MPPTPLLNAICLEGKNHMKDGNASNASQSPKTFVMSQGVYWKLQDFYIFQRGDL